MKVTKTIVEVELSPEEIRDEYVDFLMGCIDSKVRQCDKCKFPLVLGTFNMLCPCLFMELKEDKK